MSELNKHYLPEVEDLNDLESDFKVFAGPGAGKTTWLISHLEKVLTHSTRLGLTKRVACITYTNVAADEIVNNLHCDKSRLDVSTIHSFLYNNIINPFSVLIRYNDNGEILFDTYRMDGHQEHIFNESKYQAWIRLIEKKTDGKNYFQLKDKKNKEDIKRKIQSLYYKLANNEITLDYKKNGQLWLPTKNGELWDYKYLFWKEGILHHEDVLYFSYLILLKYPDVVQFLRNKYAYIFVDEFQDTSEMQAEILDKVCNDKVRIAILGDLAQSIYKFAGAKKEELESFRKGYIDEYKISINHRSTKCIVELLNTMRNDIIQKWDEENGVGEKVIVLVGDVSLAKNWLIDNVKENDVYILCRENNDVLLINSNLREEKNYLEEFTKTDSNFYRVNFIISTFTSYKYYEKGQYKDSIRELITHLKRTSKNNESVFVLRKIAVTILENLLKLDFDNTTLYDFYKTTYDEMKHKYKFDIGSDFKVGRIKEFYSSTIIGDILPYIKTDIKVDDLVRTIHSAKGLSLSNVMVYFNTTDKFEKYILESSNRIFDDNEEGRVYYVACSRAKERLFFNIPEANEALLRKVEKLGMSWVILKK